MPEYRLSYFPVKGRGEAIRLLLADVGADYEDKKVTEDWPEIKKGMRFGQLPCLNHKDFQLVQSTAILRYLGKKHGIAGDNDQDAALIDMFHYHIQEIREEYTTMIYNNYEDGKGKFVNESLPGKLRMLEKHIADDGFILEKISWADYNFFDLLNALVTLSPTCLDDFPKIKAYKQRMEQREGIRKRTDSDDCKKLRSMPTANVKNSRTV